MSASGRQLRLRKCALRLGLTTLTLVGSWLCAQESTSSADSKAGDPASPAYFRQHIRPVFEGSCLSCHDGQNKVSKLDLSTREGLLRGGDRGPGIVEGNARASLLFRTVTHETEPRMPVAADKLPQEAIDRIAAWIDAGARYDGRLGESSVAVATKAEREGRELFQHHIRPLFEKVCLSCHNPEGRASGLVLSTQAAMLRGGDHGPAVVKGNPKESLLYKAVAHEAEPHMPFRAERLPQETIDRIAEWITAGAPYEEPLKGDSSAGPTSNHWAFQPPSRPEVPEVRSTEWTKNPIDRFVAFEHEERGLTPLRPASKRVQLRRVYLDLMGLPPTPEEIRSFLEDDSPGAYEKVVDRLLASSQYGERWGRHWMDIWRYSDWYGRRKLNDIRYSQPHVWRWRDWIVESLNEDKGYDRMILEMLAGDEMAPTDPDVVRATGYLVRNWYKFNRNVWLQDTVEYTSMSMLGITMKCARCHDHKYDPILQTDYYRMRAIFEPHDVRIDRVPGEPDRMKNGLARVFDAKPGAATYRFIRGSESNPDKDHPLRPAVPSIFRGAKLEIKPIEIPLEAYYPDSRSFIHADLLAQAKTNIEKAEQGLVDAKKRLAKARKLVSEVRSSQPLPARAGNRAETEQPEEQASAALSEEEKLAELRQAEAEASVAEKELLAARAHLPALEARIAADRAKFGLDSGADVDALIEQAIESERKARLLKADEEVARARFEFDEALRNPEPEPDKNERDKKATNKDEKKDRKKKFANEKKVKEAQGKLQAALESLKGPTDTHTPIGDEYSRTSTGRRLALARWIANQENPLTARVAVNHIWLRHFGKPLVPTVFNFGQSGKPPSHPELLDWMALEFMESGWSMKTLHRLIVTSRTYRTDSFPTDAGSHNMSVDPENAYLWRMNPRRMEAEVVRDSLLHLAGRLDATMGGADLDETTGQDSLRRSLYFRHTPDSRMTFLKLFDAASPIECFQRNESVTPHQALALSNSKVSYAMSRVLTADLGKKSGESRDSHGRFAEQAFETVLGRPPKTAERQELLKYLDEQTELYEGSTSLKAFETGSSSEVKPATEPHLRARESLVHVLFNHNEFVTIR